MQADGFGNVKYSLLTNLTPKPIDNLGAHPHHPDWHTVVEKFLQSSNEEGLSAKTLEKIKESCITSSVEPLKPVLAAPPITFQDLVQANQHRLKAKRHPRIKKDSTPQISDLFLS